MPTCPASSPTASLLRLSLLSPVVSTNDTWFLRQPTLLLVSLSSCYHFLSGDLFPASFPWTQMSPLSPASQPPVQFLLFLILPCLQKACLEFQEKISHCSLYFHTNFCVFLWMNLQFCFIMTHPYLDRTSWSPSKHSFYILLPSPRTPCFLSVLISP